MRQAEESFNEAPIHESGKSRAFALLGTSGFRLQ